MIDLGEILLRPLDSRDVEALYRIRNDPNVVAMLGGFSSGYSRQDLREWLESHRTRRDEVLWAIALAKTDECIGHVGLYQIDHRVGKGEFAILIGRTEYQGRGLGRRIMQYVEGYGFRELRLNKIALSVLADNERARQLYDALGFEVEGVLRDEQFRNGEFLDVILMAKFARDYFADEKD